MLEYQTMETNHPYINPQENPVNALFRLLQLQPPRPGPISHNEAQLFEAICYQARRTHHALAASLAPLQTLLIDPAEATLPASSPNPPQQHANLANANLLLQHEADIIHAMAEIYQTMVTQFYCAHPHLTQHPASAPAQDLIAQFDKHYYFPLGKLMQQLPGDITNVARLTPEQGQMCHAVAQFAARAVATLQGGLAVLDKMLAQMARRNGGLANALATEFADSAALRDLIAWCRAEADFMQECGEDYRDAAENVLRAV
jgi:hypothetical protein